MKVEEFNKLEDWIDCPFSPFLLLLKLFKKSNTTLVGPSPAPGS